MRSAVNRLALVARRPALSLRAPATRWASTAASSGTFYYVTSHLSRPIGSDAVPVLLNSRRWPFAPLRPSGALLSLFASFILVFDVFRYVCVSRGSF